MTMWTGISFLRHPEHPLLHPLHFVKSLSKSRLRVDPSPGELYLYKGLGRKDHRSLQNQRSNKYLTLESNASPKEISFQKFLSQYASQYNALCPPAAGTQSLGRGSGASPLNLDKALLLTHVRAHPLLALRSWWSSSSQMKSPTPTLACTTIKPGIPTLNLKAWFLFFIAIQDHTFIFQIPFYFL